MSSKNGAERHHIIPFGTSLVVHPDDCHGKYAAELLRAKFNCPVHVAYGPAPKGTWAIFTAEGATAFKKKRGAARKVQYLHIAAAGMADSILRKRGITVPQWAQTATGFIAINECGLEMLRHNRQFEDSLLQIAMQCGGKQPERAAKRRRHRHGRPTPWFQGQRDDMPPLQPPYAPPQA